MLEHPCCAADVWLLFLQVVDPTDMFVLSAQSSVQSQSSFLSEQGCLTAAKPPPWPYVQTIVTTLASCGGHQGKRVLSPRSSEGVAVDQVVLILDVKARAWAGARWMPDSPTPFFKELVFLFSLDQVSPPCYMVRIYHSIILRFVVIHFHT